ncbi:MAG TPA: hypothetical protein VFP34_13075 [Microlunatus sp.]|nr:hypothetical protein [Microlunatus sp.]
MFSVQAHPSGVGPWVGVSTPDYHDQVSRTAAARHAVMEAVRERRHATRSARRSPRPARVKPVATGTGVVPRDTPVGSDELTPVG